MISTPMPSTSRNTPCSVGDLGQRLREVARSISISATLGSGEVKSGVLRARRATSTSAGGGVDAVGDDHATVAAMRPREHGASTRLEPIEVLGLVGAEDLDPVGVGEVEVADQAAAACAASRRHRGAAFAPGDPGERQRLAVVVKQPRDADLQHAAAMR